MNAPFILSPAVLDLDHARDLRRAAIRRATVVRKPMCHSGHTVFTKLADGTRKIEYPVFKTGGWHSVEIIPVGIGRYSIIQNGKERGRFETRDVYRTLRDFRKSASDHLDMWRRWEAEQS